MAKPTVTQADREYFRRLGNANERLCEADPALTLTEVFRRLDVMERNLAALAKPAALPDAEADREAAAIVLRFRKGRGLAS